MTDPPTRRSRFDPWAGRPLVRYGLAALVAAGATAATLLLTRTLAHTGFLLFFAAVLVVGWLAGRRPALVCVALALLVVDAAYLAGEPLPRRILALALGALLLTASAVVVDRATRAARERRRALAEQATELLALAEEADAGRRAAEAARDRARFLGRVSRTLGASLDAGETLRTLARLIVDEMADYAVTYRLDDGGTVRRVGLAHADPEHERLVARLGELAPYTVESRHGAGAVIRTGEPILAEEIAPELLEAASESAEHLELLRRLGPRSSMVVPLVARGHTIGAIAFATTDRSGRRYGADDLELARQLATHAALALDNARLYGESERAVALRDEILAIVAHDLRNPLQVVSTLAHALSVAPAAERAALLGRIQEAVGRGERLIQDLLEVSRIEAGRLSVEREPVPLAQLVVEACATIEAAAAARGVRVERAIEPGTAEVDRQRVVQALCNLLENALAHTPNGGSVRIASRALEGGATFVVEDTGPGIEERDLPHLFDRFWQAGKSRRGAGLGLAIVKGIAEAHGGRVRAESVPGRGSTFTLELPPASRAPGPSRRRGGAA